MKLYIWHVYRLDCELNVFNCDHREVCFSELIVIGLRRTVVEEGMSRWLRRAARRVRWVRKGCWRGLTEKGGLEVKRGGQGGKGGFSKGSQPNGRDNKQYEYHFNCWHER